jgi:hypothetical protein
VILVYFALGLVLGYMLRAVRVPKFRPFPRPGSPYGDPDAVLLFGDGTRYRVGDIPRVNGRVDPAWLDEHCKCGRKHA